MRTLSFCTFGLLLLLQMPLSAQALLEPTSWQANLEYLHQKIHNDYAILFHQISPEEFDATIKELHQQIPTMGREEIIMEIAKIVALFRIEHTLRPLHLWELQGADKELSPTSPTAFYLLDSDPYI